MVEHEFIKDDTKEENLIGEKMPHTKMEDHANHCWLDLSVQGVLVGCPGVRAEAADNQFEDLRVFLGVIFSYFNAAGVHLQLCVLKCCLVRTAMVIKIRKD